MSKHSDLTACKSGKLNGIVCILLCVNIIILKLMIIIFVITGTTPLRDWVISGEDSRTSSLIGKTMIV